MNSRILKFAIASALSLGMGAFVACGSDSGSNAEEVKSSASTSQNTADDKSSDVEDGMTVKMENDLPKCTAKREGFTVFVEENGGVYVCENFEWVKKKESSDDVPDTDRDINDDEEDVIASSSGAKQSSGSTLPAEVKTSGYYKTHCPSGHTCTYAPTSQLNASKTYGEILDTRDYQVYKTIEICNDANTKCQTWMAQNLNYDSNFEDDDGYYVVNSWCYNDKADSCAKYGRLYLWSAAMDSAAVFSDAGKDCGYYTSSEDNKCAASGSVRGVCPSGWHLPSYDEWDALRTAVGGSSTAGTALKSTSGWFNDGNGTDAYGFSALPAGNRGSSGGFGSASGSASFWSASQYEGRSSSAYGMDLYYYYEAASLDYVSKLYGYSIRCIKN